MTTYVKGDGLIMKKTGKTERESVHIYIYFAEASWGEKLDICETATLPSSGLVRQIQKIPNCMLKR